MNINCPICGTDIPEGSTNCPGCGLSVQDLITSPEEKTKLKEKKQREAEEKERQLEAAKAAQEATAAEQEAEARRIAQLKAEQEAEKEHLEAERAALREEAKRLEEAKKNSFANTYAGPDHQNNVGHRDGTGNNTVSGSQKMSSGGSKSSKKSTGVIAAVCAVALLGAGAAGYTLFLKKPASVNMNPYLDLEFSGVDGEGYAECHFNLAQLVKDNEKVFTLNDKSRAKIRSLVHMDPSAKAGDGDLITALFADLYDNGPVSLVVEPDTDLKNGEKVSISWIGGEETLEDLFGVNFICDRSTFTVKGLEEGAAEASADQNNNSDSQESTVVSDKKEQSETEASHADDGEEAVAEEVESEKPASDSATTEKPTKKPKDIGKYRLVNTDYLTLRSTATINNQNNKMLQIPGNAELTVLQFECNGYWKVKYDGKEGYVLPSYLSPCDGAKEPEKIASYKVITDYVTMRDIPSTEGESFGKITTGEVVDCFDTADNGFLLILYKGRYGYILKNYNGEVLLEKV